MPGPFTPIMSKGRSTSTSPMAMAKGSIHSFSRIAATLEVYVVHTRVWGGREGRRGGEGRKGGKEGREGKEGRADLERESVCVCVRMCE